MGPMYIMDAQRGIFGGPDGGVYLGPQRGIFRVPKRVYLGSKKCFFLEGHVWETHVRTITDNHLEYYKLFE